MSMRHYGVETKALVLSDIEFVELLWNNRETLTGNILDYFKDVESVNELDTWELMDYAYEIDYGVYFSEVNGKVILYDEEREDNYKYIDGDCIVVFELEKDTLFTKYENIEEIYREYLDRFREFGIKIDIPFIKDHFGKLECTYYG